MDNPSNLVPCGTALKTPASRSISEGPANKAFSAAPPIAGANGSVRFYTKSQGPAPEANHTS